MPWPLRTHDSQNSKQLPGSPALRAQREPILKVFRGFSPPAPNFSRPWPPALDSKAHQLQIGILLAQNYMGLFRRAAPALADGQLLALAQPSESTPNGQPAARLVPSRNFKSPHALFRS